jgi:hypothetical protein
VSATTVGREEREGYLSKDLEDLAESWAMDFEIVLLSIATWWVISISWTRINQFGDKTTKQKSVRGNTYEDEDCSAPYFNLWV